MLFYTMSAANKKEGEMELRGETLLNHYISMVRWGREVGWGEEANEKTCSAHSEGPRKCHENWEKKKKTHTHTHTHTDTDVTTRRKLGTVSFCICSVSLRESVRHFLPLPFPFLMPTTTTTPKHFGKLKSPHFFYLCHYYPMP